MAPRILEFKNIVQFLPDLSQMRVGDSRKIHHRFLENSLSFNSLWTEDQNSLCIGRIVYFHYVFRVYKEVS